VEFGETAKETICREVKEELDIDIRIDALLGFVDDILVEEKQHWAGPTWLASIVAGEPKIMEPEMCDGMGWFTIEEAGELEQSHTLTKDLEVYKDYIRKKQNP
jgi:ADP-ribose pyrophosphatase YjhB (NUDIX family)